MELKKVEVASEWLHWVLSDSWDSLVQLWNQNKILDQQNVASSSSSCNTVYVTAPQLYRADIWMSCTSYMLCWCWLTLGMAQEQWSSPCMHSQGKPYTNSSWKMHVMKNPSWTSTCSCTRVNSFCDSVSHTFFEAYSHLCRGWQMKTRGWGAVRGQFSSSHSHIVTCTSVCCTCLSREVFSNNHLKWWVPWVMLWGKQTLK